MGATTESPAAGWGRKWPRDANSLVFPELVVAAMVEEVLKDSSAAKSSRERHDRVFSLAGGSVPLVGGAPVKVSLPNPEDDPDAWKRWTDALGRHFATHDVSAEDELARAVSRSIAGVKATDSARIAALPLTVGTAALQTKNAVVGSENAEDWAGAVDDIYQLGTPADDPRRSPSALVVNGLIFQAQRSHLLRSIDLAVREGILAPMGIDHTVVALVDVNKDESPHWELPRAIAPNTPFSWFYEAWNKLVSEDWRELVPPRVWVDWLAATARLAIGMSTLWKSRWYSSIGDLILSDSDGALDLLCELVRNDPLIDWQESDQSLNQRNVQPDLRALLARAAYVEDFLRAKITSREIDVTMSIDDGLAQLRLPNNRAQLRASIARGYANNPKKQRRAAVETCLTARATTGPWVDRYALLGWYYSKYRVVEPTSELLVLLASLASNRPSDECTVGDVRRELARLGLRPSIPELVSRLEAAGLCRRSADASDAIRIPPAFRKVGL